MRSTPHYVEMQIQEIRRFAFHVFLLPFVAESMVVVADEEGRAAFFVPLRQPVPGGSRHKATTTIIMQTTASIQRTALRPLTISIADIKAWLNAKSELFTHMSGFCVTRREVIRVNLAFFIMIVGAAVSQVSLLAAFACVPLAGYQIYKLNQEDEDNWLKDEERLEEKGGKL